MKIVNEDSVEIDDFNSPKGKFGVVRQHMSVALGGIADKGLWAGGHPFDVELSVMKPGKKNYPYHAHEAMWEYYVVLEGYGKILDNDRNWRVFKKGDHVICPPGEAHQIWNDSEGDLKFLVIADHHVADVASYPDTGKRFLQPEGRCVTVEDVGYFKDEE